MHKRDRHRTLGTIVLMLAALAAATAEVDRRVACAERLALRAGEVASAAADRGVAS